MVDFTRLDVVDGDLCWTEEQWVDLVEIEFYTLEEVIEWLAVL